MPVKRIQSSNYGVDADTDKEKIWRCQRVISRWQEKYLGNSYGESQKAVGRGNEDDALLPFARCVVPLVVQLSLQAPYSARVLCLFAANGIWQYIRQLQESLPQGQKHYSQIHLSSQFSASLIPPLNPTTVKHDTAGGEIHKAFGVRNVLDF